jgi:hypothetical protein
MVEISAIGTLRPEGSARGFPKLVGPKAEEVGCESWMGAKPKLGRLSLEDVGVRPGTPSKRFGFETECAGYEEPRPRLPKSGLGD